MYKKSEIMEETIKKIFYTGIGAAVLSKEKMEKWAQDWSDKSKEKEEVGKKFFEEMSEESSKAALELKSNIKTYVGELLDKSGLATKHDVEELKQKIADLENKLKGDANQ
jgi:polyhydroxyalkanoate synthesis regulator phasin